ncbi:MAG: hypothetical protein KA885_11120 [Spirochaetes bacterium]|nr:hypothetical protein [Spirochaetota bacterium]
MVVNEGLVKRFGLNEALVIQNFAFWINLNKEKNRNVKEGRVWTFQTLNEISEKIKILSVDKIRYSLNKLIRQGVIVKGNFNKTKYDRTVWYAFQDETLLSSIIDKYTEKQNSQMEKGILPNRISEIPEPIPNLVTDNKKEVIVELSDDQRDITSEATTNFNLDSELKEISDDLTSRGLSKNQAIKLTTTYPKEYLSDKISLFDYLLKTNPQKMKNKARFLFMSINDDWTDDAFESYKKQKSKEILQNRLEKESKTSEKSKAEYNRYIESECQKEYLALSEAEKKEIDETIFKELDTPFYKSNQTAFNIALESKRVLFVYNKVIDKIKEKDKKTSDLREDCQG